MKNNVKKLLCAALSTAMIAGSIVLPMTASADDTALKSWKFDFGSSDNAAESGYTLVTPDVNYVNNTSGDDQYGFLGIDENSYKLGGRLDGFDQQEGQIIKLEAGGGTGLNDGIGSVDEDEYGNAGDKYYPVRFALKVEDERYYKVKATVTTLDPEKDAKASLYTERKHPLYTEKTIKAGETETTEFTIRTTPIYYEKSEPKGQIADEMVNVCVLGENTALAALEIQEVETAPTLWVVGDSTVTDGHGALPFNPMANYTGVGTGLTKYLPSNIAMVNEGEGGLNANDNNHFNMIKSRIKEGDYMYVEYGHNHKNSTKDQTFTGEYWQNNYLQALPKYYNACKDVGANLIVVGPIDRHNDTQYTAETNTWVSTLNGFSNIGKNYVDCLKYGGEDVASNFLAKWNEIAAYAEANKDKINPLQKQKDEAEKQKKQYEKEKTEEEEKEDKDADKINELTEKINELTEKINELTETLAPLIDPLNDLKAEADKIADDVREAGTTEIENVAFVDLNKPSLDWYTDITGATKKVTVKDDTTGQMVEQEFTNERRFTDYYFTTKKNDTTDGTHPNDMGAENLAYYFFATADTEKYPLLEALTANFAGGATHETPTAVSDDVIALGWAGTTSAWPTYQTPVNYEYPIVIKDISLNENNEFVNMNVYVQDSMGYYAIGVVEIYNENNEKVREFTTADYLDNVASKGANDLTFDTNNPPVLNEGETYKAYMWPIDMTTMELVSAEDGGKAYSAVYTPTDIEEYILPGENGGVEDFNHYNQTELTGSSKFVYGGSAAHTLTLGKDSSGVTYTRIMSDGAKNGTANQGSFYIMRPLENLVDEKGTNIGTGDSGRYMIDADLMYVSGSGLNFAFSESTTPDKSPFVSNEFVAFTIGSEGKVTVDGKEVGQISGSAWTNVKYILDMSAGKAEISVAGANPTTVDIPTYSTFGKTAISTLKHFIIEGQKVAFDMNLSNLTVAKLKDTNATSTLSADVADDSIVKGIDEVTVNVDKAYDNADLIIAAYNSDNTLLDLKTEKKQLTVGENKFTVETNRASKIMLWDGINSMKPLNMTVESKQKATSMGKILISDKDVLKTTVAQGNTVTVKAVPNDGCIFVKWTDSDGNEFSTEPEISARMYKDLSLKAHFAKQCGVSDTVSYNVTSDKKLIKAGQAQTVNLTLSDVFDANGNPVKYSDSDVQWSCEDAAITVANGVVTIPASYTIDTDTKDITVKSTLNNIEKTVTLTLYSYGFFENVKDGVVSATWDGATSTLAGKNVLIAPTSGTSTLTLPTSVEIGDNTVITFKTAFATRNCVQPRYFEFYDSNGNKVIDDVIGFSWSTLYVGGTVGNKGIDNSTGHFDGAAPVGSWAGDITITLNKTTGKGTVAFGTETSVEITLSSSATDIASIKLNSKSGAGVDRMFGLTDIIIK